MNFSAIDECLKIMQSHEKINEELQGAIKAYVDYKKVFPQIICEGMFIDAKDSYGKWRMGKVIAQKGENIRVHFDGWEPKWNEEFHIKSEKIAPFRTHTERYTGPDSPYRTIFESKEMTENLAFMRKELAYFRSSSLLAVLPERIIFFFRGDLYIFLDHILSYRYIPKDSIENVYNVKKMSNSQKKDCMAFLCEFIDFFIEYMEQFKKLMPLYIEWLSLKKPYLYLVSSTLAYLSAVDELCDLIQRIFGKEQKFQRFYEAHDFTISEEAEKYGYKSKSYKPHIIPILNLISHYLLKGGEAQINDFLQLKLQFFIKNNDSSPTSARQDNWIPTKLLKMLKEIIETIIPFVPQEAKNKFLQRIYEHFCNRCQKMNIRDQKDTDPKIFIDLLEGLLKFDEGGKFETLILAVLLEFLQNQNMEKRMIAVNEIKSVLEKCEKKKYKWLDNEKLKKILIDKKFIDRIFGHLYHDEIAKRSTQVLTFLTQDGISGKDLELIWKLTKTQNQEQKKSVFLLLSDIAKYQSIEGLDLIIEKVNHINPADLTESLISFIKDLTIYSVSPSLTSAKSSTLDMLSSFIFQKKKSKNEGFGVMLLYECIQDSSEINPSLLSTCCKCLGELLAKSNFKNEKEKIFSEACARLLKNESIPQSIMLFEAIVSAILINGSFWDVSAETLLNKALKEKNLIDCIVISLTKYKELVLKSFPNQIMKDDMMVGKFSHKKQIMIRLEFITFLFSKINLKNIDITADHLKKIWSCLSIKELNSVLHVKDWVLSSIDAKKNNFYITFLPIIGDRTSNACPPLTWDIFDLLDSVFRITNEKLKAIIISKRGIKVKDLDTIKGVNLFWGIYKETEDLKILTKCNSIFLAVYCRPNDLIPIKYYSIWERFLKKISEGISAPKITKNKVRAYLNLVRQFMKFLEGSSFLGDYPSTTLISFFIAVKTQAGIGKEEIVLPSNSTISGLKKKIQTKFELDNTDFEIVITHNRPSPYVIKWSEEEDITVSMLEPFKDKEGERDLFINTMKECSITGLSSQLEKFKLFLASHKEINQLIIDGLSSDNESLVEESWKLIQILPAIEKFNIFSQEKVKTEKEWLNEFTQPSFRKIKYYLYQIENFFKKHNQKDTLSKWSNQFVSSNGFNSFLKFLCLFNKENLSFEFDVELLNSVYTVIANVIENVDQSIIASLMDQCSSLLLDANIKLLSLLLNFFKKHEDCQKDTQIFSCIFGNIITIGQFQNSQFERFINEPTVEELIISYLTEIASSKVGEAFSSSFKKFISSLKNLDIKIVLHKLVELLFKENLKKAVQNYSKSFVYFDVATELLKVDINDLKEINVEFKDTLNELTSLILSTDFELDACNRILQSMLRFINGVASMFPETLKDLTNLKELASFVLEKILFSNKDGTFQNSEAKKESFSLLLSIFKEEFKFFFEIKKYIEELLNQITWRGRLTSDWGLEQIIEQPRSVYTGLKNLGCTCYMNSLIQQLYMISEFRDFLITAPNTDVDQIPQKDNVLLQIQLVLSNLKYSKSQFYDPRELCGAIKDIEGKPINVLEQMDVDEFFMNIMDKIESGLKKSNNHMIIPRTFGGVEMSELIGKDGCTHNSETPQPFFALTLTVEGYKSIYESLDHIIQGEYLSGANAYNCELCEKKVTALKRVCIKKLPNILLLVLKRFRFDYNRMGKIKVNDYCEFPLDLDMEKYTQAYIKKTEMSQDNNDEDSYPEPEYFKYRLKGVVVHMGTADSGHYYSFINVQEGWYEFNDINVRPFDVKDLSEEAFGGEEQNMEKSLSKELREKNRSAYLLFYEREIKYDEGLNRIKLLTENLEVVQPDNFIANEFTKSRQKQIVRKMLLDHHLIDFMERVEVEYPHKFFDTLSQQKLLSECIETNPNIDMTDEYFEINKLLVRYFFTVIIRLKSKFHLIKVLKCVRKNVQKSSKLSAWLLQNFSSQDVLNELLVECHVEDMKLFTSGLLILASETVYPTYKNDLKNSLLGIFIQHVYYCMTATKEYRLNHHFYRILLRFAKLGPESITLLNSLYVQNIGFKLIGYEVKSKKHIEMLDIIKNEVIEKTEPTEIQRSIVMAQEEKVLSLEEQIYKRRETKTASEQTHQAAFLVELLGTLLLQAFTVPHESPVQKQSHELPEKKQDQEVLEKKQEGEVPEKKQDQEEVPEKKQDQEEVPEKKQDQEEVPEKKQGEVSEQNTATDSTQENVTPNETTDVSASNQTNELIEKTSLERGANAITQNDKKTEEKSDGSSLEKEDKDSTGEKELDFIMSQDFLYILIGEATSKSSIDAISRLVKCLIVSQKNAMDMYLKILEKALVEKDEDIKLYFVCLKHILSVSDQEQENRIKKTIKLLSENFKKLISYYRICEIIFDYVIKLCFINEKFQQCFITDNSLSKYFKQWCISCANPKDNLMSGKLKIYVRKQVQFSLKFLEALNDSKFIELARERNERLSTILNNEVNKGMRSNYWDSDTDYSTMQIKPSDVIDAKFSITASGDPKIPEWRKSEVKDTLGDMHELKDMELTSPTKWFRYDADLAPLGTATQKYSKRFPYFISS